MRFVKTGAFAVALAGAVMTGVGVAHATVTVQVNAKLLTCATSAGVSATNLTSANIGRSVTISDSAAAQLRAHGCI